MAESKRRRKAGGPRKGERPERFTTRSLVANAAATFVVAPALLVAALLLFSGQIGDATSRELNQHLFLGAVCVLIAVFIFLLSGLKVWEHLKARKRFRELLEGEKKSAVVQNLDELTTLARQLGPAYRKQLEGRLAEMGIKR